MIFDQQFLLLYSILIDSFLSEQIIFHLAINCLRKFTLTDTQSNYSPLKSPKPYNF